MTDQSERQVFADALAVPPAERRAFIARVCGGDTQLERRVQHLLDAHEQVPDTVTASPVRPFAATLPSQIGSYKILEPLGEGGMGVVYLAEQIRPVRRRVALKIIKLGMNTEDVTARFEQERQAMALMSHPHIASILDAGATTDGRPYFVMEYVQGQPITEYCDRGRMTLAQRLKLFVEVCQAVRHAHGIGVLHRDLKPTNILVAEEHGEPFPKVIDFGIAKAIAGPLGDRAVQTEFGAFIGTPEYMSPEQIDRAETLDARSDVYALGVILYELLVGSRPIDFAPDVGFASIVWTVQHHEPPLPSVAVTRTTDVEAVATARSLGPGELRRRLRGDLDAIVMKTLEKTPGRRYAAVEDLALDIGRNVANEPVQARRASLVYRASRFARRHRLAVTAASTVFAALVIGLVVVAWQAGVARLERDRAEAALERSQSVSAFLIDLFAAVEVGQNSAPAREMLRRGVERAEALAAQPVAQAELFDALGRAYYNLGEYRDADPLLTRAVAIRDSLYPDGHPDLARTLFALGRTYWARAIRDSAAATLDSALRMSREQFGARHPFVAEVLLLVGREAMVNRRLALAESVMLEGADILRLALDPGDPRHHGPQVALGDLMRIKPDFARVEAYYQRAIEHLRRTLGPAHPSVADVMLRYGDHILEDLHDAGRATPIFREALAIQERALGLEHLGLTHALNSLAFALVERGDHQEAEGLARRALTIRTGVSGEQHINTARQREQLANILSRAGRLAEAERIYRDVIPLKRTILGDVSASTTLHSLTETLMALGRFREAETTAREELDILTEYFGADSPSLAPTTRLAGMVYLHGGRYEAADSLLRRALDQAQRMDENHPEVFEAYDALAELFERTGRRDEAQRYRALATAGRAG